MRLFHFLILPVMLALAMIGDLITVTIASLSRSRGSHLHLLPTAPRLIADTRRMGLA